MATHSNILAWKTPLSEKPGRLQSMESQRVGQDCLHTHTHTHTHTLPVKKKSLGLEGFNGKVYQKFQEELISTLVKLFQKLKKAVMLETQCIRLATP